MPCFWVVDGALAGTDSWFNDPASQVSAHFGVGKETVDCAYGVVEVTRAWLEYGLLTSPDWYWQGEPAGFVSGGSLGQGMLPGFVSALLIVDGVTLSTPSRTCGNPLCRSSLPSSWPPKPRSSTCARP